MFWNEKKMMTACVLKLRIYSVSKMLSEILCKYIVVLVVAFLMEYYPVRIIMGRIDQPPGYAQLTQEI